MSHYWITTLVLVLFCLALSQEDKFAGNLVPGQDQPDSRVEGAENLSGSVLSSNLTETSDDSVHVVHPSVDTSRVSSDVSSSQDISNSQSTEKVKKASKPIKKAESVGFVPPPEKDEETEPIEQLKVDKDTPKASSIPTLPPRYSLQCYVKMV